MLKLFNDYPWFILINSIIILIVYQYIVRNWNYFDRQKVKFIRGAPFFGVYSWALLSQEDFAATYKRCYDVYPSEQIIGIYEMGGKPTYLIRDPELIKRICIDDFEYFMNHHFQIDVQSDSLFSRSLYLLRGQRWLEMRTILNLAFNDSKARLMFSLLTDVSHTFSRDLRKQLQQSTDNTYECDAKDLVTRYICDAIGSCSFGINVNSLKDRTNEFYQTGISITTFNYWTTFMFLLFACVPKLMNFLQVQIFKQSDIDYLRKIVNGNVKKREETGLIRNDMIHLLMEARRKKLNEMVENHEDDLYDSEQDAKWEDDDTVAQCTIFFLFGFYSTSLTICFLLHELVVNPKIQERLYQEIADVQRKLNGEYITVDILHKMKYLDMVLSETLRRWPTIPGNDRQVTHSYKLKTSTGNEIQLNVGDTVLLVPQAIHMDPKYFSNPTEFDPERFNDENKINIASGSYFPFGMGPRGCIASRIAITACKSFVYHLLTQYHLEKCDKTEEQIKLKLRTGTVEAQNGYWMRLRLRD